MLDFTWGNYTTAKVGKSYTQFNDISKILTHITNCIGILAISYVVDVGTSLYLGMGVLPTRNQNQYEYLSTEVISKIDEIVDTEDIWEQIKYDLPNLSATEIINKIHCKVMDHLDYSEFATLETALNGQGNCFDYSGMIYSSFVHMAKNYPELVKYLEDTRWCVGTVGSEDIPHSWLEIKDTNGGWHNYETTIDGPLPLEQFFDAENYDKISALQVNSDGLSKNFEIKNILIPITGPGESIINSAEIKFDFDIPERIENYLPQTAFITAPIYYITFMFRRLAKKFKKKIGGINSLKIEHVGDLWHLSNILSKGDLVSAKNLDGLNHQQKMKKLKEAEKSICI
jgi:hypothetical protein